VYADLWRTLAEGKQWHGEFHNRRKDGTFFWELVTISPVMGTDGAISHYLAIKDDITDRKKTEELLRKQQSELIIRHEEVKGALMQVERAKREWEQTMDCIHDLIMIVDSEQRINRCNRAVTLFARTSYQELIGRDWRTLFDPGVVDWDAALERSVEIHHRESGRWFSLRIYAEDDVLGSVITMHDMTGIKQVATELESAYRELQTTHVQLLQQEKMASIGQLAAGVAHEINNPMGFIASNLGTMQKYMDRLSAYLEQQEKALTTDGVSSAALERARLKIDYILEDVPKLLAESIEGADRVRGIVQNLKSFSRVDESEVKRADINQCLESTIAIAWNEIKYKGEVVKEFGDLPLLRCYPQQLNQVFLNLIVNAAHAIERQGIITVRTRVDGDLVRVAVSDTGCGIAPEVMSRIFEPFFTTKEVGKGTGLGLSISYDIVSKHGGTIEVESSPGNGSTFQVTLPLNGVETAAGQPLACAA
jgi:two-component system NtrC family sensor kinase